MSSLFFRRPRLLVLTLALILVAGLSSLEVLPRYEDPELISRNAMVVTAYPGADADRVETQITEKIEDELEEIEEIQLLESTSRAGVSVVTIELDDAIQETDVIWSRVRDRLDDAELAFPAGAGAPDFQELVITAWSMHVALGWEREDEANHAILGRLAKELADQLRTVPGTDETEVFGAPREEIRVTVDVDELASYGLDAVSLSAALRGGDAKVAAGRLDAPGSELLLEVSGELDGLDRIASVPVARAADGTLVELGDFAEVRRAVADPPGELGRVDGSPGVFVAARMQAGIRIDRWAERARTVVERFLEDLPEGLSGTVVFDQSTYTERRLDELFGNLALGALLVVGTILLMMGWRSALLVGSALPLSALMVLAGMRALDIPLHQMSITGLIIALGLLIDNAIVMVDEVEHRLRSSDSIVAAVGASVRALAIPLAASTATTVLAFFPLILAPGPVGEFVGTMSVSVVLAVTSSLLLALTVIPALTGWMRTFGADAERDGWLQRGVSSARLTAFYRRALGVLFARPWLAIGFAATLPVLGFWAGGSLQEQFFPPAGRDQAAIELELPELVSIDRTREVVLEAERILRAHPEVEASHWVLGRSAPKFYYNQIEQQENAPNFAGGLVVLRSSEGSTRVLRELQAELDRALSEARVLVRQLEQGPPFDAHIELILQGPDLAVLHERGEELRALVAGVPQILHTRSGLATGRPKLLFTPRDADLDRAGFDRTGLAARLEASLAGQLGGSVFEGVEELPVRVRLSDGERSEVASVASLELSTPRDASAWVPLESLGDLTLVPEAARIPRRDGVRTNEIQAWVGAGTLPQDALDEVQRRLASFELPRGYSLSFGGEAAERDDAVAGLAASVGVLIVLMVAVLVLSFQSFRQAAIVGVVAALTVGLSLGALALFGYPFGFMAIVGSMGLMGIAINDSIVVLAALREDDRALAGEVEGTVDVVLRSTRHVLATTVTTIAGFVPLLLDAAGMWPPLATAIAGGVVGATILALTLVPGAFLLVRRRSRRREARASGGRARLQPATSG